MSQSGLRTIALLTVGAMAVLAFGQRHPKLSSGPMVGYAEMTEVSIWVQTTTPSRVQLKYRPLTDRGAAGATRTIQTTDSGDHIATFIIPGLETGAKYAYELWIDGKQVKRDYPLQFQTQPHWRWVTNPPQPPLMKIAIGSCSYITDTQKYDRPGNPYGGDFEIFTAIHEKKPDFMLWLGDNVYYREPDWLTESGMRYRWRKDRSLEQMQPLLGSASHYGILDDHDFGPNDSDSTFRLKDEAIKIFADYFPQVKYGTPHTKGAFHRFEWGDVEFFMLDDRYHRSPNRWPNGPDKVMFGAEQMRWLKQSLVSSNATFKVVAGGNQLINPLTPFEAFGRFAAEQKDLFDFLASARIEGLVFLSGDRHATELLKVQWPGAAYPWFEYTSSPLTSGASASRPDQNNPARVPGTSVTGQRNFGMIEVSGPWRDRKLTLTAHDKVGKELWKHEIKESELKAPRN